MIHTIDQIATFKTEILEGLLSCPKTLPSKYFYDEKGDAIFQEIMAMPEYYLTKSEMEIFEHQSKELADIILSHISRFRLIELGAGDCIKTIHLLRQLLYDEVDFQFIPIDISANVIANLQVGLPHQLPNLKLDAYNGEYFDMLNVIPDQSGTGRVIMVLGGNIGNMTPEESREFCSSIRANLQPGDLAIIGFDLRKDPEKILAAYNDPAGITKRFNLNLLNRINNELGADFDTQNFKHYCTYDPESGACKSYLICTGNFEVRVAGEEIFFKKDEYIFMEISQKFSSLEIDEMAAKSGFKPVASLFDKGHNFTDVVWLAE